MKKVVFTVLVVALLLSFVGFAMAAAPPRTICWQWSPYSDVSTIKTKPAGFVLMADGRNKFYTITGEHWGGFYVPVTGAGHMKGDVFHFSYTGSYFDGSNQYVLQANGFWDTLSDTGTLFFYWRTIGTDPLNSGTISLIEVDCSGWVIPYGQTSTGQ